MDSVSGKPKGQTVKEYKPDALSTDTFKRTNVGDYPYTPFEKIFFCLWKHSRNSE
jgi:hypothetical protein